MGSLRWGVRTMWTLLKISTWQGSGMSHSFITAESFSVTSVPIAPWKPLFRSFLGCQHHIYCTELYCLSFHGCLARIYSRAHMIEQQNFLVDILNLWDYNTAHAYRLVDRIWLSTTFQVNWLIISDFCICAQNDQRCRSCSIQGPWVQVDAYARKEQSKRMLSLRLVHAQCIYIYMDLLNKT